MQKRILVFLFIVLALSACKPKVEAEKPKANTTNLCEGLKIDKEEVIIPNLAKPEYLKAYTDPVFKTNITRISNTSIGTVIKPAYNTVQAWNADESLLILYHTGGTDVGHHLYDGKSYKHIRALGIIPRDIEEFFWDWQDPGIFYYMSVKYPNYGKFIRYHVAQDKKEVLRDFNTICGENAVPLGGGDVQMISWDSNIIGFRCGLASGNSERDKSFYYNIATDKVSSVKNIGTNTAYKPWDSIQPAASGKRFYLQGDVLDEKLNKTLSLDLAKVNEHAVLGKLANGHDAYFAVTFDPSPKGCDGGKNAGVGALTVHDMETGECRSVVGLDNNYGYTMSGTHVSALAIKNPAWVAISSIGYDRFEYLTNGKKSPVLMSEIYLANTDPERPVVCRLAHHRSWAKDSKNTAYAGYFGEPHPVISPSGTRILFGSDWHDSGSVDSYVIELPSYKK